MFFFPPSPFFDCFPPNPFLSTVFYSDVIDLVAWKSFIDHLIIHLFNIYMYAYVHMQKFEDIFPGFMSIKRNFS